MTAPENIVEKVRALLNRANHPNTPQPEAETAIQLAYKLMQKHGIDAAAVASMSSDSDEIVIDRFWVEGKYRVQRLHLLHVIARHNCCTSYRDFEDEDEGECLLVIYGRKEDIFNTVTIFAAADLLGQRLLPRGDRSFRTSWYQGFCKGIDEALGSAHKEFVAETAGAALVLADRTSRAEQELKVNGPRLTRTTSYIYTGSDAYTSGKSAGRGFTSPGGSVSSGPRGELG